MKKTISILILLTINMCVCAQPMKEVRFSSQSIPGESLQFLLYKPQAKALKYPLLVFLHGNRSKGTDFDLLRKYEIPKLLENGKELPFIVIAPQLPADKNWSPALIDTYINYITTQLSIDLDRIYVTGVSIGGASALDYACVFPNKVACVVSISGWGNPHEICKMRDVPTWIFHASDDNIVNPAGARNLTESLFVCGGNVRMTEFPEGKHDISDIVYSYPNLFEWIASKSKNADIKALSKIQFDSKTTGYKLVKALNNVTGIWASKDGKLFGVNGKKSSPVIIEFDTLGHVKGVKHILQAANYSWQDITEINGDIYIADIGNENFKREYYQLYKISANDLIKEKLIATKIEFKINKGPAMDFKSSFHFNGNMYLFGETFDHETFLIEVPLNEGEKTEAHLIGNCNNLMKSAISSAYYDKERKELVLLSQNSIGIVPLADDITSLTTKTATYIDLPNNTQKEAITKLSNSYLAFADKLFLGTFDGNLYLLEYP